MCFNFFLPGEKIGRRPLRCAPTGSEQVQKRAVFSAVGVDRRLTTLSPKNELHQSFVWKHTESTSSTRCQPGSVHFWWASEYNTKWRKHTQVRFKRTEQGWCEHDLSCRIVDIARMISCCVLPVCGRFCRHGLELCENGYILCASSGALISTWCFLLTFTRQRVRVCVCVRVCVGGLGEMSVFLTSFISMWEANWSHLQAILPL